jgi:hypothetical protein
MTWILYMKWKKRNKMRHVHEHEHETDMRYRIWNERPDMNEIQDMKLEAGL